MLLSLSLLLLLSLLSKILTSAELLLGCAVTSMPNAGTLSALIAVSIKLVLLEMELHAQFNNRKGSICIVEWI